MTTARTPAQVLAGEAVSGTSQQRWNDMLAIASVMVNRAAMLGVSLEDVVSIQKEFNAYSKQMPPGTQNLVDMAQAAIDQVQEQGPVNNAAFYSTPAAVGGLPKGLVEETETAGHKFFSDPAMRAIETAQGYIRPDPKALPSLASQDPLRQAMNAPYEANGLLNGVTSLTNSPPQVVTSTSVPAGALDPAFSPSGLLSGNFPASQFTAPSASPMGALATGDVNMPNLTPSLNSFAPMANAGVPGGEFAGVNERMGLAPEGFDPSRFAGQIPSTFDPSRFGATDTIASVMQTPSPIFDAPEPHPNVNNFAEMAAAPPVQAPISVQGLLGQMQQPNLAASANVPASASLFSPVDQAPNVDASATGILGVNPALAASTTAVPTMGVPASADLGVNPALTASATATPVQNTTVEDRMGIAPSTFDASRFGVPAVNVPATADLGTTPALAASTAATPSQFGDINSPEMQAMKANVEAQLGNMKPITATPTNNNFAALAAAGPLASPVSVTPTGILGTTPALTASTTATPTGLLSSLQETPAATPAENAITGILSQPSSLMSPTSIESQPNLSAVTPTSSMLANSVTPNYQQYQSFVPSDVQAIAPAVAPAAAPAFDPATGYQQMAASLGPTGLLGLDGTKYSDLSGNLTQNPALSTPSVSSLDTAAVADQPSIASPTDTTQSNVTVQGPATATDTTQDQANQGSFPAAPTKTGMLGGLINKGTITGGLLGSLAAGPFGGILGGVLGNQINKQGGLTGLLGAHPMNINNIGTGLSNIQSVYGSTQPGLQATASDGQSVTSLGNGFTAVTNKYGVTTTFGPNGFTGAYFGPSLTGDSHTPGGPPGGGGGVGGIGGLL